MMRRLLAMMIACLVPATALMVRFLYFYVTGLSPSGHVQSLIAAAVLGLTGVQLAVLGALADLIAVNRRLVEELRARDRERK